MVDPQGRVIKDTSLGSGVHAVCPKCKNRGRLRVKNTRFVADENQIIRWRECERCKYRVTTSEVIPLTI